MKTISPIAIDMGAKYTGIYLSQYFQGETLEGASPQGLVVMHSENLQYSQADRTARRHQTRAAKRKKMAKRLLWVILKEQYQLPFDGFSRIERDAINSLLNRRGFTYLSEDVDEALLQEMTAFPFHQYFHPDVPSIGNHLLDAYQVITKDVETAEMFQSHDAYSLNAIDFAKSLEGDYKEQKAQLKEGLKAFKQGIDSFIKAEQDGHKIRAAYLDNIKIDITHHNDYLFFRDALPVSADEFANLVGHISNLQLRVLRRYFNDEKMKTGDFWNPVKLHKVFFRNISALHYKKDSQEKANQVALFSLKNKNIIDIFESTDPKLSIPPFEDQNNRRPPKCQSLKLTAESLNKYLPKWSAIVPKLADEVELKGIPVKSGLSLSNSQNVDGWAQCLQRILEFSYKHDPFQFRKWINKPEQYGEFTKRGIAEFERIVQKQHRKDFIDFVTRFYQETEAARSALWFDESSNLLKVCNQKTPHKGNQLIELISGAVNTELSSEQFEAFEKLWREENPRVGKRGLKGWCNLAVELQKEYGNALKEQIRRNIWLQENKKKVENKKLIDIDKAIPAVAELIAQCMNIDSKRFANVFDLAKLHNLMEEDPKGFSKNCRCCTKENIWRSRIIKNAEQQEGAVGLRLPADTTRPFDGLLARLMDKQAYEIAKAKVAQLPAHGLDGSLSIPILLEENRFKFTASLAEVKRNTKSRKDNEKKAAAFEEKWQDKNSRIKSASKGICPYKGTNLETGGEIDHIIPRAESKGRHQTVFNHEANLIYCSPEGNSNKNRSFYTLSDLHNNYLQKQFNTTDRAKIKQHIIELCTPFINKGQLLSFTEVESEVLKQAIRHGLFVEELRYSLMNLLHQSTKTRVNGTQGYLAKLIMQKIKQLYKVNPVEFHVSYIEAQQASELRKQLGEQYPELAKPDFQPVASHVIDAAMVMAAALKQPHTQDMLQTGGLDRTDWLKQILPENIAINRIEPKPKFNKRQIQSQQLFKDGIYGEHFVPLIVSQGQLGVGFDSNNVAWLKDQIEAPELWWNALQCYLNNAPQTFERVKKNTGSSFKAYSINKSLAFELLHKVAKQACSEDELLSADLLESLLYTTQKVNIKSAIYDEQKKTYKKQNDLANEKNFVIKVDVNTKYLKPKFKGVQAKQLCYPGKAQWKQLITQPYIQQHQGSKESFDSKGYQYMINQIFADTKGNTRNHKKVRKNWSLPIKASASGGYRAKRRNADGSVIWQLFAVEGLSASGFNLCNEVVDFSESATAAIPALIQSPNIFGCGQRYQSIADNIEKFDSWRQITITEDLHGKANSIAFSPNSKSRFRIRVEFTNQQLIEFVIPLTKEQDDIKNWSQLPAEIKLSNAKKWKECFGDLLGKPRSNLFITNAGMNVVLEYIVEGTNSQMKNAYQAGIPIG